MSPLRDTINLTPSPAILEVIAEVDMQIHHCLAELIDNGMDELKEASAADPTLEPRIDINLPASGSVSAQSEISVADNGRGMNLEQLEEALRAGSSGKHMHGSLGMFGMGFNIATARLGNLTEVRTGRQGDAQWIVATIDLRRMQDEGTYDVPIRTEDKDPSAHGTTITVRRLREDTVDKLNGRRALSDIRSRLGRIYTYLLRDPSGAHSGAELMGGENLAIYLNGRRVDPYLPCIWDPSRTVNYKGDAVPAASPIDIPLSDGYACMSCGRWHTVPIDRCTSCGGTNIETRSRRIWGWIGIQRYTDSSDLGFSFFRNGRCIVDVDHSLFQWEDSDGTLEKEYPIELGQGRIVGEIHLDHAKPQVRKTDFDRQSIDWLQMRRLVRGEAPLRPNIANQRGYAANSTILARYFSAFRRNEPGTASLIPGNGQSAIHTKTKAWAQAFRKGDAEYLTDEKWWQAAAAHDRIKFGTGEDDDAEDNPDEGWLIEEGLIDLGTPEDVTPTDDGAAPSTGAGHVPTPADPTPETDDERFARYRSCGQLLPETNSEVRIGSGKTTLRVYVTSGVTLQHEGRNRGFALRLSGGEVELFIEDVHRLIGTYGWDALSAALLCAAPSLQSLYRADGDPEELVLAILEQYPDRRIAPSAARERADALMEDSIRDRLVPLAAERPHEFWEALGSGSRRRAQNAAVTVAPDIDWDASMASGDFARYLDAGAILDLLNEHPELVMDGKLFRATYASLGEDAQADQVARLSGLIVDLRRMANSGPGFKAAELLRFRISADLLSAEVVRP